MPDAASSRNRLRPLPEGCPERGDLHRPVFPADSDDDGGQTGSPGPGEGLRWIQLFRDGHPAHPALPEEGSVLAGIHAFLVGVDAAGELVRQQHRPLVVARDLEQPGPLGGELEGGHDGHAENRHGHDDLEQREPRADARRKGPGRGCAASAPPTAHESARRLLTLPVNGSTVTT